MLAAPHGVHWYAFTIAFCSVSEQSTFRWLRQLLVLWEGHISSQFNEDSLHCVVSLPIGKAGQFTWVNLSSPRIHAGQIDFRNELENWRFVGVAIIAMYVDTVDPVLVHALPDC